MSCYNKIEIGASPSKVWETIENFHDMSWAPDVISSIDSVGEKTGREIGAKRILNGVFHETLIAVNSDDFTFSYSIDDGPGPVAQDTVNNYIGIVTLKATDAGTLVEWGSTFDTDNKAEVIEFCDPIYQALLAGLKQTLS